MHAPEVMGEVVPGGYILYHAPGSDFWSFKVFRPDPEAWGYWDAEWIFGEEEHFLPSFSPFQNPAPPYRRRLAGVTIANIYGADIVAVEHWLVVMLCGVFYLILKWRDYRRRRRATAAGKSGSMEQPS